MAKKQKSFAEKATDHSGKELVHVKLVKSVPSNRKGFWRFNESMISMEKGQNLDSVLKQMEDAANLTDIEMPTAEEEIVEVPTEKIEVEAQDENVVVEEIAEETVEVPAEEPQEETTEAESTEEKTE